MDVGVTSVDQAGDIGGNGVSRFHWVGREGVPIDDTDVSAVSAALHSFYTAICANLAAHSITYAVQPETLILDDSTGKLTGAIQGQGLAPIPSLGAAQGYSAGAGARINWLTGVVVNHRRVRGATFIVPIQSSSFTQQGALSGVAQQELIAAAGNLNGALQTAGCNLIAYHRPAKGATTGGVAALVSAWTVGTRPAMLRSRAE